MGGGVLGGFFLGGVWGGGGGGFISLVHILDSCQYINKESC
jgi:hypothetical protein